MVLKHLFIFCSLAVLFGNVYSGRVRRVVGGEEMPKGMWPWLVSLNFKGHHAYMDLQGLEHLCGGTLIDPLWVLTAAHCVHHASGSADLGNASMWEAVLGEHDRRVTELTEQRIAVEEIFVYYNYTIITSFFGDIALLKLQQPAQINQYVRPVRLDSARCVEEGQVCKTGGWGQQAAADQGHPQYGNGTWVPHYINIMEITIEACQDAYATDNWIVIDNKTLCYMSNERKDTCQGDSGGPLVCVNDENVPVLTGIVSVGFGCASEQYPGVYTRVSSYKNWIVDTINQNTSPSHRRTFLRRQAERASLFT